MFRLAVVLGKTVAEIERMSSAELSEWMVYAKLEPLPDGHWDAASISFTLANVFGGKGKRPKFEDFLPRAVKRRRKGGKAMSPEQSRGLLSKLLGVKPWLEGRPGAEPPSSSPETRKSTGS